MTRPLERETGRRLSLQVSDRRAEQLYSGREVAGLLGISMATFYRLSWFKARRVFVSKARVGYAASDVALYQSIKRGAA